MRLKYLDVLKAFAIIAVVLYHSGFLTYGYLGVDLFLVINGYLITKSLNKKILLNSKTGGGKFSHCGLKATVKRYYEFEQSRILRLLPVLLIAGIVGMVVSYFVMLPDDYENLSQSVIATNLFSNNILAAITTKNYWDVVNEYKPLMHTWYVGVVMQFYLVYPILFFIARLSKKNSRKVILTMIAALAIVSLILFFFTTDAAARFYYLPYRFFEFAAGGVVALVWIPQERNMQIPRWVAFLSYVFILGLMSINVDFLPANLRLVAVVALSVILIMSIGVLENKLTGNGILAKMGAASYSIFVWHQVLLAYYRYTYASHFTFVCYLLFVLVVGILSWLTFQFVEQKFNKMNPNTKGYKSFVLLLSAVWIGSTCFAWNIYQKGGVVRDVPELYIGKNDKVNHKVYNDKIYQLDKPYQTNKLHWLVVGNSFGRDFANTILESDIADSVELRYIYIDNYRNSEYADRFTSSDRIFLSSLGTDEMLVKEFEKVCIANGFDVKKLVIVGTKNFGECNGQFYVKRNTPEYFAQRTRMENGYFEMNKRMKSVCGDRYLDLISLVIDKQETMPVFTPDHHFVSQDCRHFSMGGAKWFATLIDWNKYIDN